MNKSYKFSIVIAIYNMENYLLETIESVVNQTIGFEEYLQILLVNDGSTDNSEAICKSYVSKYPENMIYIVKENGGVSEARNKGIELATGELVNFLDADDKLELDVLEKVYAFFEQNKEEVDLISIPLCFFDGQEGTHILNHKFTSTRVVDIFEEPMCFQMHISSSFIRLEEMKKYAFQPLLKIGEDAEVANKIILNKGKYGVIADTKYWYRKRSSGGSAIQNAKSNKASYTPTLKYLHLELIDFAIKKYNYVPEYLQWLFSYDLGWKLRTPFVDATVLDQTELEEFHGYVKQVLQYVKDEVILASSTLRSSQLRKYFNWYLLKLKYTDFMKDQLEIISNKEDALLCLNNHIIDMLYKQVIYVEDIHIQNNQLRFQGNFNCLFELFDFKLIIEVNGMEREVPYYVNEAERVTSLNQLVAEGYSFVIEEQLDKLETIIKAKGILGETKSQIKFMIKQDESGVKSGKSPSVNGDYKVIMKNKEIIIKNTVQVANKEEHFKEEEVAVLNKDIATLRKLYLKNKILPASIAKLIGERDRNLSKIIMEQVDEYELLHMTVKKIPINYRYYLLSQLKYAGNYELRIATTFDQACLYNKKNVLLTKATDITVCVEKSRVYNSSLILNGTIASPLEAYMYQLKCCCDKQILNCDLKINNRKTQQWFGEKSVECCEFEVSLPLKENSEFYFVLNIGISNSVTKLQITKNNLYKTAKKAGIKVNIKETKKISLSYCKK